MRPYDLILIGAGCAGLSLALAIVRRPALSHLRLLLIDPVHRRENDRTWCFWGRSPAHIVPLLHRSWQQVTLVSAQGQAHDYPLQGMGYHMLKGEDFYRHAEQQLAGCPSLERLQARALQVHPKKEGYCRVETTAGDFFASWVFDSRFAALPPLPDHKVLWQHFLGWRVRFSRPLFQPGQMRMFDFRVPDEGEMRFMYVLPEDEREALLEFTIFSAHLLPPDAYRQALEGYLSQVLGCDPGEVQVLEREQGILPMTDYCFPQRYAEGHYAWGMAAGACKPSTGYAFLRIQRDAEQVAEALLRFGEPRFSRPLNRFWLYDAMILDLLDRDGKAVIGYFMQLFERNGAPLVLRFLDEDTRFPQELRIMYSVPSLPFMAALGRVLWRSAKRGVKTLAGHP